MYILYLDEFGHIGPFEGRDQPKFNESPVFGLGGLLLPAHQVRDFASWFFERKKQLLGPEITRDRANPAVWEKKGSALYTTLNITKYRELRNFTNRFLNRIHTIGGHVVFAGFEKGAKPQEHKASRLYISALREVLRGVNAICQHRKPCVNFLTVMDEHSERDAILTSASSAMFGGKYPQRNLLEPPFQVESHRYQTIQASDWVCGLLGRYASYRARPAEYHDLEWAEKYFGDRLRNASIASQIRNDIRIHNTRLIAGNSGEVPGMVPGSNGLA